MGPVELVANTLASVILAALMFVPFLNILVASLVGAGIAGYVGFVSGAAAATLLTAAEVALMNRSGAVITDKLASNRTSSTAERRRPILEIADWRQIRRGIVKTRLAWSEVERRAA